MEASISDSLCHFKAAYSQSRRNPIFSSVSQRSSLRLYKQSFDCVGSCESVAGDVRLARMPSLLRRKVRAQGEYSSANEVSQVASDEAAQEVLSWSSVILPFLFPALGGLLFGYDIGATSGATISLQLGYLVGSAEINAVGGWRYMYGFAATIADLMGLGMWSLPPSPRWLLLRAVQGKASIEEYKEKAINALSRLRGRPIGDRTSEGQIEETLVSLKSAYADQDGEASLLDVFKGPSLKAFIIAGGLVLFQQITGQPSVLYYAASILQSAGFSAASDAARVSVIIGVFKLLMTGVAVLKVDGLGRRPLLIGGVSGIVVALSFLAAYYKVLEGLPIVAVVALLLYVGSYQISFGPISWLMVSEIFPIRTRGRGISLAVLTNFGSNALVTFAFPPLQELLGADNLFVLFGGIALLALLFVLLVVPETKGLSLEEIESKILK